MIFRLDFNISFRKLLAVSLIISSTLSWFFFLDFYYINFFSTIVNKLFWVYMSETMFLGFAVFSAIVGSLISERVNRRSFLFFWIALGIPVIVSSLFFRGIAFSLIFASLLGTSIGLGFPSCLAFLADSTSVEERGRVAGIAIFVVFFFILGTVAVPSLVGFGLITIIMLCLVRLTGLLALAIDPFYREMGKQKSWGKILSDKELMLYIFPWIMVNIADGLRTLIWPDFTTMPGFQTLVIYGYYLRYLGIGFFGLIAGMIADRFGRKQPIILGLLLYGIGFGFLGFYGFNATLSVLAYLLTSGVGWSFLFVVYFSVLGDLAFSNSKEKYYAIGMVTPIAILLGFYAVSDFFKTIAPLSVASPILSIVLFLSIFPVSHATETLNDEKIRSRKMRQYLEKVFKLVKESKTT